MAITASMVKELREKTGAGMMDCKKALTEVNGDIESAIDFLRTKGLAKAAKKQGRIAAEGIIGSFVDGSISTVVEVNCETDFVAKNDDFNNFVVDMAKLIASANPADIEALKATKTDAGATVEEVIQELTLKIGEKIDVRRFNRYQTTGTGSIATYVHTGKIGVMAEINFEKNETANKSEFVEFTKNLAMHIAATDARFLGADEIDEDFKAREAAVYETQLKEQGKPEKMIAGIIQGKLKKLASEVCLLEQKFVMDPDFTITTLAEKIGKEIGDKLTITKFSKITLGEGIEKKEDNLADEVAKMTKQ
jgi:elongation factor Ts